MRPALSSLALVALIAVAPIASAQDSTAAVSAPVSGKKPFSFGIMLTNMSMDPLVAANQKIGARSWGMQLDGGISFARFLYAGVDFAPQFLSDRASFTQSTTAGDMSSTAMLMYYSAMGGARTPSFRIIPGLAPASLGMFGGASLTTGKRSIDKCVDCLTEDITVKGGTFVQPTLVFGDGSTRLRVSDRYYLKGEGIKSVISLGFELGTH